MVNDRRVAKKKGQGRPVKKVANNKEVNSTKKRGRPSTKQDTPIKSSLIKEEENDNEDGEPVIKKGREMLKISPSKLKQNEVTGLSRGRPKGDPNKVKPAYVSTGLPRGRPKGDPNKLKPAYVPTGISRGRPKKRNPSKSNDENNKPAIKKGDEQPKMSLSKSKQNVPTKSPQKRPKGNPNKSKSTNITTKSPQGKQKKNPSKLKLTYVPTRLPQGRKST